MDQPPPGNWWYCLQNLARAHIQRIRKAKSAASEKKKQNHHAAGSTTELEDRISQLPQHILQNHILSLLPQRDAVRTCLLSKSWRHLGPTRPKFEFRERSFPTPNKFKFVPISSPKRKEKFISVVENTLQRYVDQNLPIQEFVLEFSPWETESKSTDLLLNKWIPIVIINTKVFNLTAHTFSLPFVVFQSEFLEELFLVGCKLNQIISNSFQVMLNRLRKLSLVSVCIDEGAFQKIIMSSCRLIEYLVLDSCIYNSEPLVAIFNDNYFFPRLKSLHLCQVHVTTESLNNLSTKNCPCLEELELHCCSGFTKLELSSRSIKRLIIATQQESINITLDVPNMIFFKFASIFIPSISIAPTWNEWTSHTKVWRSWDDAYFSSTWSLKLYEFLKALSQSQISLDTTYLHLSDLDRTHDGGISGPPVVVEHLRISANYSSSWVPALLNLLFRICRPVYIELPYLERQLVESIWKALVNKGKTRECDYFWEQDLEELSIHVLDENAHEWRAVRGCELSNNQSIQLRLKWREI